MSEDNVDLSGGPENHPRTLPRGRCYSIDWLGVGREGFDKCQIPFFLLLILFFPPLSARPIVVTFSTRIEIDPCLQPDLDKSFVCTYTQLLRVTVVSTAVVRAWHLSVAHRGYGQGR
jgi:hypothetical protein